MTRRSPSSRVKTTCGSRGVHCTCEVSYSRSSTTSASAKPFSTSPMPSETLAARLRRGSPPMGNW